MWRRRDKCTGLKLCLISDLAVVLNTVTDDLASICSTSNGLRKHGAIAIFREGQIHALLEVNRPQYASSHTLF